MNYVQTIHARWDWPGGPPINSAATAKVKEFARIPNIKVRNPTCDPMGVLAVSTIYMLTSMRSQTERVGFHHAIWINGSNTFQINPFALINMQNPGQWWFQRVSETLAWGWVLPPGAESNVEFVTSYDFSLTNALVPPVTYLGEAAFSGSVHADIMAVV